MARTLVILFSGRRVGRSFRTCDPGRARPGNERHRALGRGPGRSGLAVHVSKPQSRGSYVDGAEDDG